jgi:hypothetical protein
LEQATWYKLANFQDLVGVLFLSLEFAIPTHLNLSYLTFYRLLGTKFPFTRISRRNILLTGGSSISYNAIDFNGHSTGLIDTGGAFAFAYGIFSTLLAMNQIFTKSNFSTIR